MMKIYKLHGIKQSASRQAGRNECQQRTSVVGGSPSKRFCPNKLGSLSNVSVMRWRISGVRSETGRSMRQPVTHGEGGG